jgi:SLT domain-containing protein
MKVANVSGAAWTNGLNLIISHESSGNPNAINKTDSNAAAGHPSQGLMQLIPSTFQTYALPGYNSNIDDPVSNIVAGIRYIQAKYGGIGGVPGVKGVASGSGYVGYARGSQRIDQTQLALLHKGEAVVPAADNYSTNPYNTGGAANGGGNTVHLNFGKGSIVLQVPAGATQQDMDKIATQFAQSLSKPNVLSAVRST